MSFKLDFRASLEGDTEIKRKFEDLEKTLQDVKKAADDASKPLEETAKAMDDLGKSAGDVDKDLKDTSGALDDVSKSAGDINKDLDDVSKSFDDISKSAVDVSTDLKDADSAFSDIASNADGAVSSMDAVKSSFDGISDSAVEADQNIAAATTGLEGVGTATESAAAGADSLASSLDNIAASAQEAETNISAAANGIDGIGTSIGQAETALDGLGSAFDGAGTATTTFNDVLTSTGTQAQAASGGLTPLNTVLGQVGGATQQAQGGFQGFNSSLGIMTGFIGTAASGVIQFVSALNNLHGAQIKVDATQAKLSTTSEAVAKAQAKLNDLYSSGSASAEQISQATLDLQQATEKNSIAIERAGKAQDDLNIKYAKFATDVLPGLIQSITSTVAVASQLHDKFKGTETSGLVNFFTEGETGAKGFASALAVLALSAGTAWAALELYKQLPSITSAWTKGFEGDLDGVIKSLEEYRDVIKANPLLEPIFGQRLDQHIAQLKLQKQGVDDGTNALRQYGPTLQSGGALLDKFGESTDKSNIKQQQQKEIIEGQKPVWQHLVEDITGAVGSLTGFAPAVEQAAQGTENFSAKAGAMASASAQVSLGVGEIETKVTQAAGTIDSYVGNIENATAASEPLNAALQRQVATLEESTAAMEASLGTQDNAILKYTELANSIATHQTNIEKLNASLNTQEGQLLSYTNAVAAGNEKFLAWVQNTRDAAVEAETFKGHLEGMANTFGGLPGFMEGTVQEYQAFIEANTQGGEAVDRFADMALESWRNLVSEAEPLFNDLKEAWSKVRSGIWEEGELEGELIDPVLEAFRKLPPAVAQTLDEVELKALSFQGEFAATAEEAGTAWATNLQANMGQGFDQALQQANQAAADVLAPFIAEHPETAQMFQPLFDAMNQTGPGAAQAVQEVLTELAGMPGPMGETAGAMLKEYQDKFAGQLPGVTKTGVEGAITDLTQIMSEGFNAIITKLNELINTGIKQDPASVPLITANVNPANEQIQSIGTSLTQLKQFLEKEENKISIHATETNPLDAQIQLIGTSLQQVKDLLAVPLTITIGTDAAKAALDELNGKIDAMAGKNVTITVDTGPAGIAITGLQGQIDAVVGKNVTITVDTGPAGIAITGLQGQIDGVHGKNVTITVDTGAAGIAIREIQGQIDNVHGTNVYITVDTSGAQAAIQQLQQQINSLQQSMGGMGGGYTPGYQSPYGSYQGAYGSPYGYAQGFGPAVVNRPTRMLVGEAGPEFVSVIPMKGRNRKNPPRSITAAAGMGQQSIFGQNYGYSGQGLWQTDAEEEAYKRQVQQSMQQGSQQGSSQGTQQGFDQGMPGMQNAVQQGASQGVQEGMQQGYQQAPSNTELWGAGRFTWGGGAAGTQLGGMGGGGAQYPTAPSNTELWGHPQRFTWTGGAQGTQLGSGMGGGGMMPIPPNFWSGTAGGTRLTANPGGPAPAQTSFQAPASYGKPLGQLINGIAATILPGQGPRGPPMQAAFGMHRNLRRDTLIQAHRNERVDITPNANAADTTAKASEYANAAIDKITALLEKLLSQGSTFKVDFNVDGRKMSSVAAKHMGTSGYGDK